MRIAVWIIAAAICSCDRRADSNVPDTPAVQTLEQYEASLPFNPVRDSADAIARAIAAIDEQGNRGVKRVTSVTRDSVGYLVTVDLDGPYEVLKGIRMLVKQNGAVYSVVDIRDR